MKRRSFLQALMGLAALPLLPRSKPKVPESNLIATVDPVPFTTQKGDCISLVMGSIDPKNDGVFLIRGTEKIRLPGPGVSYIS